LQKFIQDQTPLFDGSPGGREIKCIEIGHPASRMHHEIGFDQNLLASRLCAHAETAIHPLDRLNSRAGSHIDADLRKLLHQPANEIGIELREHPPGSLQHGDLRARTRRDVGELSRDIATAHHDDARRKFRKLKELVTRDQVFSAGKGERHRLRTGRD
jgi:hypothetical protein